MSVGSIGASFLSSRVGQVSLAATALVGAGVAAGCGSPTSYDVSDEAAEMLSVMDENGDGTVHSKDEVLTMDPDIFRKAPALLGKDGDVPSTLEYGDVKRAIAAYDENHDGRLYDQELQSYTDDFIVWL
jgi:hypothetical protein